MSEFVSPVVGGSDNATAYRFLDTLSYVRVRGAQTNERCSVVEMHLRAGHAPPMHVHESADETTPRRPLPGSPSSSLPSASQPTPRACRQRRRPRRPSHGCANVRRITESRSWAHLRSSPDTVGYRRTRRFAAGCRNPACTRSRPREVTPDTTSSPGDQLRYSAVWMAFMLLAIRR